MQQFIATYDYSSASWEHSQ